jgi:hypothetical protein
MITIAGKMYELKNYNYGDTLLHYTPVVQENKSEGILNFLSVYDNKWHIDCLSIDKNEFGEKIKYHAWYNYDKYDEGLEKNFTINILKNNNIMIEYDENVVCIPIELYYASNIHTIPEVLSSIVYEHFTYTMFHLGKLIHLALCKYKSEMMVIL